MNARDERHLNEAAPAPAEATLERVERAQKKLLAADILSAQVVQDTARRKERDWKVLTIAIVVTVVGVVGFFAGNILVQAQRYPKQFAQYEAMLASGPRGKASPDYSMYQVATSKDYPTVSYVMTIGVWPELSQKGALFLMQSLTYLSSDFVVSRGFKLSSLHWNGTAEQTGASKLVGPTGWACAVQDSKLSKETLLANWIGSKEDNIWYHAFPDPSIASETDDFLNIPIIKALYIGSEADYGDYEDACNAQSFEADGSLYELFDGGLCNVAFKSTRRDQSSDSLFNDFFMGTARTLPTCTGNVAQAALQGGMTAMGLAMPMAMLGVTGVGALLIPLVAAAGAGSFSYMASRAKAQNTCETSDEIKEDEQ